MTIKINVLFVCLGNICRSPMAEAVFSHQVNEKGLSESFHIDSAGTAGYHIGSTPDKRSAATCNNHGVPVNHRARKVTKKDFDDFDYILCMDQENMYDLKSLQPKNSKAKLFLFGEFDAKGEKIIEDPYYGGIDGFEHNFKQCQRCAKGFLAFLGH